MENVVIRNGEERDCPAIMKLMSDLHKYNKSPSVSSITANDLEIDGFGGSNWFKTLVAETDDKRIVGYTLYYFVYSTFKGRSSHIRDFFVKEEFRHTGVGKSLLKALFNDVMEVGCQRADFACAKWNSQAIQFYKKYGAINLTEEEDWNLFRIAKDNMIKIAEGIKIKSVTNDNGSTDGKSKQMGNVLIRKGEKKDGVEIMEHIISLGHYEEIADQIKINAKDLEADGFGSKRFYRTFVAEEETAEGNIIIGYAIYFLVYSSLVGRTSYMEDLFVTQNRRQLGVGGDLWKAVIQDVLENGCKESDFSVLKWNTPSIEFYKKRGAVNLTENCSWESFRFDIDAMKKIND